MPNIPAARRGAVFLVVVGDLDAVQNAFGGYNLIRPHHQQHIFRRKHAVTGEDIQNGMLAEKSLGEVNKIGDNAVVASAQNEVNSKLLLVLDFLVFCVFASLT